MYLHRDASQEPTVGKLPLDVLIKKCRDQGFHCGIGYPDKDGKVEIFVKSKFVEFVRLTIKLNEVHLAAQIIIDTFEEQQIWK